MKIIIWHKRNFTKEDEIKVYSLGNCSDEEAQAKLRELWERELNKPEYDIDEHLEDTFFEEVSATVKDYDWEIKMWIDILKEV